MANGKVCDVPTEDQEDLKLMVPSPEQLASAADWTEEQTKAYSELGTGTEDDSVAKCRAIYDAFKVDPPFCCQMIETEGKFMHLALLKTGTTRKPTAEELE